MQLKYELTLQDDLDASRTSWEYTLDKENILFLPIANKHFPTVCLLLGTALTICGMIIKAPSDEGELIGVGIVFLVLSPILFWLWQPNRGSNLVNTPQIKKAWANKEKEADSRLITIAPEHFIVKTSHSEMIWQWQALKDIYEGSQGFALFFIGASHLNIYYRYSNIYFIQIDALKPSNIRNIFILSLCTCNFCYKKLYSYFIQKLKF